MRKRTIIIEITERDGKEITGNSPWPFQIIAQLMDSGQKLTEDKFFSFSSTIYKDVAEWLTHVRGALR